MSVRLLIGFAVLFLCLACRRHEKRLPVAADMASPAVIQPAEGPVKILWLEKKYDSVFNAYVESIELNQDYFSRIDNAEKAIIGYYATFHGNECWWEHDKPNDDWSNLRCKILDALQLGYQCSDTHLDFLRKWLRTQPELLRELEHCTPIPHTSTQQDSFEEISVERKNDIFTIRFTICAANLRDNITRCYEEIHTFRIYADAVEEIKGRVL